MYYVIVKSLVFALRGSLVGWGKFERKGTVQQPTGRIILAEPSSEKGDIGAK